MLLKTPNDAESFASMDLRQDSARRSGRCGQPWRHPPEQKTPASETLKSGRPDFRGFFPRWSQQFNEHSSWKKGACPPSAEHETISLQLRHCFVHEFTTYAGFDSFSKNTLTHVVWDQIFRRRSYLQAACSICTEIISVLCAINHPAKWHARTLYISKSNLICNRRPHAIRRNSID